MTRSILFSLVVIGAVVSLVTAAGTFATFTDTQTITGEIDAGTISLYITDGVGDDCPLGDCANEAIFDLPENMLPGESATWTVRITNNGSRAWDVTDVTNTASEIADPDGGCDYAPTTGEFVLTATQGTGNDHPGPIIHVGPSGDYEEGTITYTMPSDLPGQANDNLCQGNVWGGSSVLTVTGH